MSSSDAGPQAFDTSVAHIARVYDYWLGGKDNYAADRAVGDQVMQAYPNIVYSVKANRAFLARAVSYLAGEAGIRQFHPRGRPVGGSAEPGGLRGQRPGRALPRPGAADQ